MRHSAFVTVILLEGSFRSELMNILLRVFGRLALGLAWALLPSSSLIFLLGRLDKIVTISAPRAALFCLSFVINTNIEQDIAPAGGKTGSFRCLCTDYLFCWLLLSYKVRFCRLERPSKEIIRLLDSLWLDVIFRLSKFLLSKVFLALESFCGAPFYTDRMFRGWEIRRSR